jgi:excisionase family DNA binding protein
VNGDSDLGLVIDRLVERVAQRVIELQSQHVQHVAEASSPWMGIAKAGEYLDWPRQRLYKLTASGAIPHYKQDRRLLFHRGELDHWLAQHAQPVSGLASSQNESYPSGATRLETTRRATTRQSPE